LTKDSLLFRIYGMERAIKKIGMTIIQVVAWFLASIIMLFAVLGVIDEWIVSIGWFKKAIAWLF